MPPKRKIPSRKFAQTSGPKRKIANRPPATKRPARPKPAVPSPTTSQTKPPIPQCFWDMGFESMPTIDELRQRYKELSLVLHPDVRGSKDAFVALRQNYETAQSILLSDE